MAAALVLYKAARQVESIDQIEPEMEDLLDKLQLQDNSDARLKGLYKMFEALIQQMSTAYKEFAMRIIAEVNAAVDTAAVNTRQSVRAETDGNSTGNPEIAPRATIGTHT
eukprot:jgi/Hompol1/5693/HPOL_004629-RA